MRRGREEQLLTQAPDRFRLVYITKRLKDPLKLLVLAKQLTRNIAQPSYSRGRQLERCRHTEKKRALGGILDVFEGDVNDVNWNQRREARWRSIWMESGKEPVITLRAQPVCPPLR